MTHWTTRARALADTLQRAGDLHRPEWHAAVAAVPRHRLVPTYYRPDAGGRWQPVDGSDEANHDEVYSDTTLVTAVLDVPCPGGTYQHPVSSSTAPGLMVRMIEEFDPRPGQRVLEIGTGTGTGYNAALLCARLGDRDVFSVDLRPELVDAARERLADLGYQPILGAADGSHGLPDHAPYERILATCAVPAIPPAWLRQLHPGGMLLADLKGGLSAGNPAILRRTGDEPVLRGAFPHLVGRVHALTPRTRHPRESQPA